MSQPNLIIADGRWSGQNGIGRFSREVLSRLKRTEILTEGPLPLSLKNLIWQPFFLQRQKNNYQLYFSPGFNPIVCSALPYVMTLCDLIHLQVPGAFKRLKKTYYEQLIKPSAKKALKVLTISEHSKNAIIEWATLPPEKVINVGCGVSAAMTPFGQKHDPGHPYFLHVGNTKPHKNISRLLQAFLEANISHRIKLIFTSPLTASQWQLVKKYKMVDRIQCAIHLNEQALAEHYRGAIALLFPSLYEGFGLPILEAMASGTPVITSQTTSMPEVAGPAALLIDPYQVNALRQAIETVLTDDPLRSHLITQGLARAQLFSWEKTAHKVQAALDGCL